MFSDILRLDHSQRALDSLPVALLSSKTGLFFHRLSFFPLLDASLLSVLFVFCAFSARLREASDMHLRTRNDGAED